VKKLLAVVFSLAVVLGGVAYASIPDPSGVIHGCYKTSNPAKGALVVIDSATETCPSGTVSLNWNQEGPQGATGATGPQGPAGPESLDVTKYGENGQTGVGDPEFVTNGGVAYGYKFCGEGEVALGGGFGVAQNVAVDTLASRPLPYEVSQANDGLDGWEVVLTSSSSNVAVYIYVNCAAGTFTRVS
jgi:hypothetical protein